MKTIKPYGGTGQGMVLSNRQLFRLGSGRVLSGVETNEGVIFTLDQLAFPERTGKIKNLMKTSRDGDLIWAIEPRIPATSPESYDYFTWLRVHDAAQNQIEAYTASGYRMIVDASSGEVRRVEKDHIFRYLEIRDGTVILENQKPLDLKGKKAQEAIEVDDGIIVLIHPKCYPELEESRKLALAIFKAESAGLPKPFIRPDFPRTIANLIKAAPDGTIIQSLAPPPRAAAPYVNIYDELVPGVPPNQVQAVHWGAGKPNACDVIDAYSFKVLRTYPV